MVIPEQPDPRETDFVFPIVVTANCHWLYLFSQFLFLSIRIAMLNPQKTPYNTVTFLPGLV